MADKKTTKGNTKGKADNGRNSSQKNSKQNPQESPRVKVSTRNANYKEITAIILLMVCAFIIVCITGKAGIVGNGVRDILFGFFGLFGTILTVITVAVLAITVLRGTASAVFTPKTTVIVILFILFVTTLLHTLSKVYDVYRSEYPAFQFVSMLSSLWNSWETDPFGGGLFAGALSTLLQYFIEKVGALVILVPLTLIFTLLLFRFSLLPFFTVLGRILTKIGKGIASLFRRLFSRKKTEKDKTPIKVVRSAVPEEEEEEVKEEKTIRPESSDDSRHTKDIFTFDPGPSTEIRQVVYDDLEGMPDGSKLVVDVEGNPVKRRNFKVSFDDTEDQNGNVGFGEEYPETVLHEKDEASGTIDSTSGAAWLQKDKKEPKAPKTVKKAEPEIDLSYGDDDPVALFRSVPEGQLPVLSRGEYANYKTPPSSILDYDIEARARSIDSSNMENRLKVEKLKNLFTSHDVNVNVPEFYTGPSFSQFVIEPEYGQKINLISGLSREIGVQFATKKARLIIPLEGRENAIGLELPNEKTFSVFFKEMVDSPEYKAINSDDLPVVIGKNVRGDTIVSSMKKLLHVIVGGTTGSGKSVFTSGIVLSIVFRSSPDQVRMILVDPKKLDFSNFRNLPHLLKPPITEPKDATAALGWTAYEMDKRYEFLLKFDVTGIEAYNEIARKHNLPTMPRLVVLIDEFADLLEKSDKKAEEYAVRIARLGRACGIHLVLATQRPSADVFTGNLKANIPSKCCLKVNDGINSRIILDNVGGETLNGNGDMLYLPNKSTEIKRVQNAMVEGEEIRRAVRYINENNKPSAKRVEEVDFSSGRDIETEMEQMTFEGMDNPEDDKYNTILRHVLTLDEVSVSEIQRDFGIGYNNAAGILNRLIKEGYVESTKPAGSKKRKVLRKEI